MFNIVLCDISINSSTHHWDLPKLNHMMAFTNPSRHGTTLFIDLLQLSHT